MQACSPLEDYLLIKIIHYNMWTFVLLVFRFTFVVSIDQNTCIIVLAVNFLKIAKEREGAKFGKNWTNQVFLHYYETAANITLIYL